MPTLKDVANVAGVSVATVSHVINETRYVSPATRARVEDAATQLSYTPDEAGRQLALHKSGRRNTAHAKASQPVSNNRKASQPEMNNGDGLARKNSNDTTTSLKNATDFTGTGKAAHLLLRLLRATQPISRVDLARRLNLNRSTVTDTFKPLIAAGVVLDEPVQTSASRNRLQGRPSSHLSFNSERDFFVGVNIGVRRSQVGLTTLGGEILAEDDFATPADAESALALIRARIERLCLNVPQRRLRVIGVSVSGPTDAARRKMLYAPHLGWHDVNIADALRFVSSDAPGVASGFVPVVVENDATASAIYEARLRLRNATGELLNNFILVRSGTGIGVGLVLGGEVYRGTEEGEGLAGEFGHMTIVAGGKPCACGNRGCWERYASASSASSLYMGERTQLGGMTAPNYVEIVARAEAGELRAQRTLERVGEYLGIGIGNVIMGLGVPHVIVSGRIVYGWKFISKPLHDAVAQSMAGKLKGWTVEPGEPRGAGLGGALEVAIDEFLTTGFEI
jgi:predicted NBD/HSP70 family sugar kinase/AraC-like DNA-binding protein